MLTIRDALLAMGYTEMAPQKWMKPIAFQVLTFYEGNGMLENWFLAKTGQLLLMDQKKLEFDANVLRNIKEFECWTKKDIYSPESQFELPGKHDI